MNKHDFFLAALHAGAGKKRAWVNSVFSVIRETLAPQEPFPYQILVEEDGRYFLDPTQDMTKVKIEGSEDTSEPLCRYREKFVLRPGELANHKGNEALTTTYGNVYLNYMLLVIPFGDRLPFQAGTFDIGKVEKVVEEQLTDDPEDGDTSNPPEGVIYVSQWLAFCNNALPMVAFNRNAVTSSTPKALTGHPDAKKRRQELAEENKDRLNDPAVIAKIGAELEAMDRDYLKDDDSWDYHKANEKKLFGKVRKKLFYMFGGEAGFGDGSTMEFIQRSLEEGIDPEKLPVMINSLRSGSYNRGAQTQLGGESTKTIYRMLGTVRIAEDDCGTSLGLPVTTDNPDDLVKFWVIDQGEHHLVTPETASQYRGREVLLRTPMTCKTEGRNVCRRCVGEDLAEQPDGIPAAAAGIGGRFLSLFLAAMHGKTLATEKWDRHQRLS